ncbi:MAG: hypothetical protein SVG88_11130 [Halobacteriales archaeon]|nr:hypothetical protein [Halobacteriales archaeon]
MTTPDRSAAESSGPVGGCSIALGVGLLVAHHRIGTGTNWSWPVAIGSGRLLAGSLLDLDVRRSQETQSPLDQLTREAADRSPNPMSAMRPARRSRRLSGPTRHR